MIKVSLLLLDANTIWLVGHVGWSGSGYLRGDPLSVSGDCQLVPLSPSYHTSVRQCGPTGLDEEDHYHKGGDGHAAI